MRGRLVRRLRIPICKCGGRPVSRLRITIWKCRTFSRSSSDDAPAPETSETCANSVCLLRGDRAHAFAKLRVAGEGAFVKGDAHAARIALEDTRRRLRTLFFLASSLVAALAIFPFYHLWVEHQFDTRGSHSIGMTAVAAFVTAAVVVFPTGWLIARVVERLSMPYWIRSIARSYAVPTGALSGTRTSD